MDIARIGAIAAPTISIKPLATAQPVEGPSFGQVMTEALQKVDDLQKQGDTASAAVASGESTDLHSALIRVEEASLALQLTVQVRNKLVESYQDLTRMPV
jgi:flagellar hook-basal body complex protein FliE